MGKMTVSLAKHDINNLANIDTKYQGTKKVQNKNYNKKRKMRRAKVKRKIKNINTKLLDPSFGNCQTEQPGNIKSSIGAKHDTANIKLLRIATLVGEEKEKKKNAEFIIH